MKYQWTFPVPQNFITNLLSLSYLKQAFFYHDTRFLHEEISLKTMRIVSS